MNESHEALSALLTRELCDRLLKAIDQGIVKTATRFIGVDEACQILCCGKTKFYEMYLDTGIVTKIPRGGKNVFLAQQVENVVITEAKKAGAL